MSTKRRTFSVSRICDPRHPGFQARVAEYERGGCLHLFRMTGEKGARRQTSTSLGIRKEALGSTRAEQEQAARALGLNAIEIWARGGEYKGPGSNGTSPKPTDLAGEPLTLDGLADEYERHGLIGRSATYARDQLRVLRRFADLLGGDRPVRSLSPSDVQRWEVMRRGEGVRDGTIYSDLLGLKVALNFATRQRDLNGTPLLAANPLAGLKLRNERSPRRPVLSEERYNALRRVADQLPPGFGLALRLAWESGRRITAILSLRWADVAFEGDAETAPWGRVTWRSEFDKTHREDVIPMNAKMRDALLAERQRAPGLGDAWIFPREKDPSEHLTQSTLSNWLRKAEELAELEDIPGLGWHGARRAWASRRRHMPLRDVMAAGGWASHEVVLASYMHADAAGILSVVNGA